MMYNTVTVVNNTELHIWKLWRGRYYKYLSHEKNFFVSMVMDVT